MKSYLPILLSSLLATVAWAQDPTPKAAVAPVKSPALRVIVSTDFPPLDVIPVKGVKKGDPPEKCSDPDDVQSMVRFLLYANEFDVEGLIASAGSFANVARKQNILDMLDLYDQVDENLRRHDARYPTAGLMIRPAGRPSRSGASMLRRISPAARTGCCRERHTARTGGDGNCEPIVAA